MKQVNEHNLEYRNIDSGVKYLMRGPNIDWGVILIKPKDKMAEKPHGHNYIDETFYFVKGDGIMVINDKEFDAPEGSVFLVEPREMHNIKNVSNQDIKVIFIKSEFKPDDKI